MKKLLSFVLLALTLIASSCAENKSFEKEDGSKFIAEPYGWANFQTKKIEGVKYEVSLPNVCIGVIFSETIFVPVILSGWELFQPIEYVEPNK